MKSAHRVPKKRTGRSGALREVWAGQSSSATHGRTRRDVKARWVDLKWQPASERRHSVHTPPSPEGRLVFKSVSGCRTLPWRRKSVRSTAACRTRPRRASLLIVPSYLAQGANGVLRLGAVVPSVPIWTHRELRLCTSCTCARGIRSSKRFGALSCRMRCSEFCIRARNGRLHRTCCTRYGHVPLFLADAQIARIAYGNFGSLSCRFGASQMHS